jgi:hypothetical protein
MTRVPIVLVLLLACATATQGQSLAAVDSVLLADRVPVARAAASSEHQRSVIREPLYTSGLRANDSVPSLPRQPHLSWEVTVQQDESRGSNAVGSMALGALVGAGVMQLLRSSFDGGESFVVYGALGGGLTGLLLWSATGD